MIDAAVPGGRVVSVRRLRGGLSARVHAISIARRDGIRTRVVLRRTVGAGGTDRAEQAVAEYRTLTILNAAGVPAPRPLLLDIDHRYFADAAILMSFEGRPIVSPRQTTVWLGDLADALMAVETVTPDRFDLTFLTTIGPGAMRERLERPLVESIAQDPLARAARATLQRHFRRVAWRGPCLIHRDFWPGNTVWRRGRLSAIIDWSTPAVGDPRIDLSQCRVDLAMMHGVETADSFLRISTARSRTPVSDVWFFDLLTGLDDALGTFHSWLPGYHDLGLTHLTEHTMEERLRAFLTAALRSAPD